MFDEIYDYYEQSELDLAHSEFLKKVNEIIKSDLKNIVKRNKEKEISLKNEWKEISIKRKEIEELEKSVIAREQLLEKTKGKIVADFLQNYGLDLNIGQEVWYIVCQGHNETCDECNGMKEYEKEIDGEIYTRKCNKCNGSGKIYIKDYSIKSGKVKKIKTKIIINKDYVCKQDNAHWWCDDIEIVLENDDYHSRKNLYLTEEDAIKVVNERKAKEYLS